ncbi:HPr family phosphocarrier protein [Pseudogracilibacillus sp. SE30717A]|uniref:HPr family phosphocarrier protein n=1 Tax=Pseudogracilibacillus sp. SE30717A TaxID=3098293 RepID=UPI00300E2C92
MVEKSIEVSLESGLQARPAAQFVQEANRFTADLFLEKEGKRINAKSIMGLMSLAITKGETITLIADGPDEEIALNELESFITSKE